MLDRYRSTQRFTQGTHQSTGTGPHESPFHDCPQVVFFIIAEGGVLPAAGAVISQVVKQDVETHRPEQFYIFHGSKKGGLDAVCDDNGLMRSLQRQIDPVQFITIWRGYPHFLPGLGIGRIHSLNLSARISS